MAAPGPLERWLAEARVDDAARRRARERWLRQAAAEDASLAGVLADLGERSEHVTVCLLGGRRHHGRVRAVGLDFCLLATGTGEVVIALGAVAAVRTGPGSVPSSGERRPPLAHGLVEVLAALVAERERALIVTSGGSDSVAGEPCWVGRDVVAVRPPAADGAGGELAYLPIASVAEVVLG